MAECFSTHLIDGKGAFNGDGLDEFITQVKMRDLGLSYAVVAIMGPQSSGKSTLLNHLFRTNFREMNDQDGRSQTTLGIWIAKCTEIEPCTVIMDLEGNDGSERGENNTAFEKQIALFALAVSDIVLINMWCKDIGREKAANKPLLRTVFQAMMQLCTPRKTTLMFVIRDKENTPLEKLESHLREDIQKIWDGIPKPEAHKQTQLSDFFTIRVEALAHYIHQNEEFKKEVAILRKKFSESIEAGGLAGDRQGVVAASGFSLSAQKMWKAIKKNKNLDLPAHSVMVANIRCQEIAVEKYSIFDENKDWLELKEHVESNAVPGFGKKLSSLLAMSLSSYDEEADYFDESVKNETRKQLHDRLIQLVQPTIKSMWEHIKSGTLKSFKEALNDALKGGQEFEEAASNCTKKFMTLLDKQCQDMVIEQEAQDLDEVRDTCLGNLTSHTAEVRNAKITEFTALYESNLKQAIYGPVEALLQGGSDDAWTRIRTLLHQEIGRAVSEFSSALSSFDVDEQATNGMISKLKSYASELVESKARDEAAKVSLYMKERYVYIFNHDNDSRTRFWTDKEDIQAISKSVLSSCLTLLSVLAAIRLDNDADTIRETLFQALLGDSETSQITQITLLASNTWEKIPPTKTLITPYECLNVWKQLQRETEYTFTQAIASQEKYKQSERERKELIERHELERKEQNEINEQNERKLKELDERNKRERKEQDEKNERNERELKEMIERSERERNEQNKLNERKRQEQNDRNMQMIMELNERNERERKEQNDRNEQNELERKEQNERNEHERKEQNDKNERKLTELDERYKRERKEQNDNYERNERELKEMIARYEQARKEQNELNEQERKEQNERSERMIKDLNERNERERKEQNDKNERNERIIKELYEQNERERKEQNDKNERNELERKEQNERNERERKEQNDKFEQMQRRVKEMLEQNERERNKPPSVRESMKNIGRALVKVVTFGIGKHFGDEAESKSESKSDDE